MPKHTSTPPPTFCKCIGVMNRLKMRRKCWQSSTPRRTSMGRVSSGFARGKRRRIRGGRLRRKQAFRVEVCEVSSIPTCAAAPLDVLTCTDAEHLGELLHQYSVDPWSVYQAFTELRKGGFTVLFIVLGDFSKRIS